LEYLCSSFTTQIQIITTKIVEKKYENSMRISGAQKFTAILSGDSTFGGIAAIAMQE
jgi:hypothetical protein